MTTFRLPAAVALALFVTVSSVRPARAAEVTVRGWGFDICQQRNKSRLKKDSP